MIFSSAFIYKVAKFMEKKLQNEKNVLSNKKVNRSTPLCGALYRLQNYRN